LEHYDVGGAALACLLKRKLYVNTKWARVGNREGVIMKGKVKGETFGNVQLVECAFTNR
jgi:hypothetical protein